MKKLLVITTTAMVLFTIFFTACRKTDSDAKSSSPKKAALKTFTTMTDAELLSAYANVGTLHNNGLDYAYNQFLQLKASRIAEGQDFTFTQDQMVNLINQYSQEYVMQAGISLSDKIDLSPVFSAQNKYNYEVLINAQPNDYSFFNTYYNLNFSEAYLNIYNSVFDILNNNDLDYAAKINRWDDLLNSSLASLDDETEKTSIICGINTAKSTYTYWMDKSNVDKWNNLFGSTDGDPMAALSENTKNDIQGAFGGAAGAVITEGATATATFGPGGLVCVTVAGAVHGAVTGTLGAAIWKKIWSWFVS